MNYKKKYGLLIIVMLLLISVGYALINTTLKLNGSSKIKKARWDIYFDKVEHESGVTSTETKIDDKKTTVSFDIDLEKPGDYYQFNVDTVNDGTIDAIIDSTELTGLTNTTKEIIDYDVTYSDGSSVNKCDTLNSGDRKTLLVKVKYFDDVKEEELLENNENLKLKFKINYVQSGACSREPILEIDPNGGIYNESRKVTKQNVTKNTSITIPEATREGYNFINWQTAGGVDLEKDSETHLTTVNMGTTDQKIIAQWEKAIDPALIKHTITINPNGGLYNGSSDTVTYQKKKNEIVEVSTNIEREGYIFTGWVLDPVNSSFSENTLTVGLTDVTLTAGWELNEDEVVAKIGTTYYVTLQKAFNSAKPGDKIELLKDITEISTNRVVGEQEVFLDLGGHTITGTINNLDNTNLRIDNGKIQNLNVDQSPVVNNGTLTIGTNDDTVSDNSIILYGKTTGLAQNGQFYFYDGYIEGDTALRGGYNGCPNEYYVIVIWDSVLNCQKAKLSLTPEGAKVKVRSATNGVPTEPATYVFYFSLDSGIKATTNTNPDVYVVVPLLENSDNIDVVEGQVLNIHLDGNTIENGSFITNNGTLTIEDAASNHGTFNVAQTIVNNDTLNINNITLAQSSNTQNTIENHKDINVTNSTVTAKNAYALYNKNEGDLTFDSNATFSSTGKYGFYNDSTEEVNLNGGNFVGIHNKGTNLIVNGTTVTSPASNPAIYNETGTITLRNVTANTTDKYVLDNKGTVNVESGTYEATNIYTFNGSGSSSVLNITGGTIRCGGQSTIYGNGTVNISGNNTYISNTYNGGRAIYCNNTVNINGGNISSTNGYGIYQYSGTLNINGGNITNSSSSYASVYVYGGATNINGGNIISENNTGVYTTRTTNIKGGYIKGKTYGVYITNSSYGKLTIGIDDDNVDPYLPEYKPVIIGGTYGLYKNAGTVDFYDGIIKGKNNAVYYGEINEIADGTEIVKGTETIDSEQYYTAYLYVQNDFLQVYGGDTYNSLKKAINAISGTGKIIVYRNGKVSSTSTVPSSKNITLDLHGNKITSSVPITNEGTLTIIDDGEDNGNGKTGTIENIVSNIIYNKKTLVIDEGIFTSTSGNIVYQYYSNATTTINGGTFTSGNGIAYCINNESGSIDIEGGTFDSSSYNTIYISSGTNTIKNATISNSYSSGASIYNNATVTLDNVTINNSANGIKNYNKLYLRNSTIDVTGTGIESSTGGSSYRYPVIDVTNTDITSGGIGIRTDDYDSTLNFYSGTITSDTDAIYNYGSNANIYSGTIYGKNRGIYMSGYYSSVITNIGNNTDSTIADVTTPVIIGDNYGIHTNKSAAQINFYDGIIKSKNTQISGLITSTPDGYITEDGVDSLDSSYKTTYLVTQRPFIQVGDDPTNVFNSLQQAITAAGADESMKLVGNGLNTNTATVSASQDINLDLNGYTMTTTKTIVNNGTFTIEDKGTTGAINSSRSITVFQDNKNLTIKSGNYNINGTLISTSSTGNTTIEGGTIIGNATEVISNEGTLTITGGTIDFTASYLSSLINSSSNVKITGGTIGNTTNRVNETIRMQNYSKSITLEVDGDANIVAGSGYALSMYGDNPDSKRPSLLMKGGTIYSKSGDAIDNCTGAITMYGGIIKSDYQDAISSRNSGTQTIYGGELIGKRYGLYASSSTVTIGTNDSEIKLVPIIKGDTYGLYNSGSTVKFYDGILKGKNSAVYYGNISATATNTIIGSGSETDPDTGDTYYTKYLVSQQEYIINKTKSGNPTYSDLQLAITEADSGDELELYGNGTIYSSITFPDKTLKLDLNNYNISISNPITNNGTVTIIDENTGGTKGKISTVGDFNLVTNNKNLTINNISLENTHSNYYIINNKDSSTLNLTNVDITGKCGIKNNEDSIINMTNTNITSNYKETLYNSGGTIDITGGEIKNTDSGSYYNIYGYSIDTNHKGTVTIRNATLTKNSDDYSNIYLNYYDTVKLYNTNVNGVIGINQYSELLYDGGTLNGHIGNGGKMSINNVTLIESGYYGIYNQASLDKLVEVTNSSITINNAYSDYSGIRNTGNIYIENTDITMNNAHGNAAIYNYSSGKFNYYGGNISVSGRYSNSIIYGIRNNTNSSNNNKIRPDSINVGGAGTSYGIYNQSGTLTLLSGEVEANNSTTSYGLYLAGGEVIMGTYDGSGLYSADVSINDPVIKGIGTTGYGAYRTDGYFRFFDGKILGSTKAKVKPLGTGVEDFAPTQAEYNYVVRTLTSAATGYEYAILECLAEKGATEVDWKVKVTDDDEIKTKTFLIDNIAWTDSNNNPISQLQYGAIGNIMITIDGTSMSSNFRYRISVNMPDGSPITVTNNNHEEIMDLTQETTKDYTIALNCSSPTADYTQVDSDIPVTITIEKITE